MDEVGQAGGREEAGPLAGEGRHVVPQLQPGSPARRWFVWACVCVVRRRKTARRCGVFPSISDGNSSPGQRLRQQAAQQRPCVALGVGAQLFRVMYTYTHM